LRPSPGLPTLEDEGWGAGTVSLDL
jgi:hypothetical protein